MPYCNCKTVEFLPVRGLSKVVRLGLSAVLRDQAAENMFQRIKTLERGNDRLIQSLWYQRMTTLLVLRFPAHLENRHLVFDAPLLPLNSLDWLLFYLKVDKTEFPAVKLYQVPKGTSHGRLADTGWLQSLDLAEEANFYTRHFPLTDLLLKLANGRERTAVKISFFRDHEKVVARSTVISHSLNKTFTQSGVVLLDSRPHNLQEMRGHNIRLAEAEKKTVVLTTS